MSTDFKKVSILDDRLMTTDSLNYGVFRGGQNVTNVRMPAISATDNALNFVVPFPSESTVLDREVYLRTETHYNISFTAPLAGIPIYGNQINTATAVGNPIVGWQCPLVYGYNISVGSFPTQRSMDTIQVQLNNDIQTINVGDVLPALLRCSDSLIWEKENMTASTVDKIALPWYEVLNGINNTMGGYDLVQGNKSIFNGSFNNELIALDPVTPYINGQPNQWRFSFTPSGSEAPTVVPYGETGTRFFCLKVFSTEPLVAPPFIWNKTQSNRMGIYGLQNFSVVCNYGNIQRAIKLSPQDFIFTPTGNVAQPVTGLSLIQQPAGFNNFTGYEVSQTVINAELQMKYITPHGTDVKPLRNVIPLLQYPRFITSGLSRIARPELKYQQIPFLNEAVLNSVQGGIDGTSAVLASQTYTLNQVPDKLIIFVRPSSSQRTSFFNDYVLPITNINIQWNNHAGILANASQEQLFHMSKEAGSSQDFLEFQGVCNTNFDRFAALTGNTFTTIPVIPVYNPAATPTPGVPIISIAPKQAFPQVANIPTIGSYLMLDVAKHLELQEPYYAPGSLGSFQLQFNVSVQNYNHASFFGGAEDTIGILPEIVVIPVNSGIMVTEKGQTSSYTGILTKSDVLDASLQEPYGQMEIQRIVGHGHQDKGNALPKRCHPRKKDPLNKHQNMGMDHRLM
jgi:hypothetical protein